MHQLYTCPCKLSHKDDDLTALFCLGTTVIAHLCFSLSSYEERTVQCSLILTQRSITYSFSRKVLWVSHLVSWNLIGTKGENYMKYRRFLQKKRGWFAAPWVTCVVQPLCGLGEALQTSHLGGWTAPDCPKELSFHPLAVWAAQFTPPLGNHWSG